PLTRREPPLRASNLRLTCSKSCAATDGTERSTRLRLARTPLLSMASISRLATSRLLAHAPERRLPSGQPFLTLRAARATLSAGRTSGPPERRGAWRSFIYLCLADGGVRPPRTPLGAPDPMKARRN